MKVEDFKITSRTKRKIREIALDVQIRYEYLLRAIENPFGNNDMRDKPFPFECEDYLKNYKNMEHYIWDITLGCLHLKYTLAQHTTKDHKEVSKVMENVRERIKKFGRCRK